jgi:hypothetical protein
VCATGPQACIASPSHPPPLASLARLGGIFESFLASLVSHERISENSTMLPPSRVGRVSRVRRISGVSRVRRLKRTDRITK